MSLEIFGELDAGPITIAAYEALKRGLAPNDWRAMNDYADAKSPLIEEIKARASTRPAAE